MSQSKWVRVGSVRRFDRVAPDKEQALKPMEEASEVFGAWQDYDRTKSWGDDWSEYEEYLIRKWYPEKGPSWDAWRKMLPNRTYRAIQQHANRLGVKCIYRGPKSWTKSEDRTAMSALVEVCKTTGRTPEAVIRRLDHIMHEARKKHRRGQSCA